MSGAPYSAPVWAHFDNPRNIGAWDNPGADVATGEARTPAGPAMLRLQCRIEGGEIREARFQAFGGVAVIAVGSWLTEWLRDRDLAQARALDPATVAERLQLAAVQRYSAIMAVDALAAALARHDEKRD